MKTVELIGRSQAMQKLAAEIDAAGRSDAKVLIVGESGTGKELVAHAIHRRSTRAAMPIVAINCAGLPESILESELFGHTRGSFTGAYNHRAGLLDSANGGTAFLDEIGEMTPRMQGLLLRFLESGEIQRVGSDRIDARLDVRVIAATNRDLSARVASGHFRLDLYYRLNVIKVQTPALRERRDDISELLAHYLAVYARRYEMAPPVLAPDLLVRLIEYSWPGNVRELKNLAERMVIAGYRRPVEVSDLTPEMQAVTDAPGTEPATAKKVDDIFDRLVNGGESFWSAVYAPFITRDLTRDDVRAIIARGLEYSRGNQRTLIKLFNIRPDDQQRLTNFLRKHQCMATMPASKPIEARSA